MINKIFPYFIFLTMPFAVLFNILEINLSYYPYKLFILCLIILNFYLSKESITLKFLLIFLLIILFLHNFIKYEHTFIITFFSGVWAYSSILSYKIKMDLTENLKIFILFIAIFFFILVLNDYYTFKSVFIRSLRDLINPNTFSLFFCSIILFIILHEKNLNLISIILIIVSSLLILSSLSRGGALILILISLLSIILNKNKFSLLFFVLSLFISILIFNLRYDFIPQQFGYNNGENNSRFELFILSIKYFHISSFNTESFISLIFGEAFGAATNVYFTLYHSFDFFNLQLNPISTNYLTPSSLLYNGGYILLIMFVYLLYLKPLLFIRRQKHKLYIFLIYLIMTFLAGAIMPFNENFPFNVILLSTFFSYFYKNEN